MSKAMTHTGASPQKTFSLNVEEAYVLGHNVNRLRRLARMDKKTFAQVAGITRPTLDKIERGESDLKLSYLRKLADALDVRVVDLLTPAPADAPVPKGLRDGR